MWIAGAADKAVPARDERVCCDALSYLEFIRVRPELHDTTAKFMTEGERRFGARMQPGKDAQVGATHSAGLDLNQA